jgi:thioesterase domain-containing protein
LEEIAAAHIESMRSVQAQGPYLLGGFCNGGLLAYEMARQLQAAGERVDYLGLINPSVPVQFQTLRKLSDRLQRLTRMSVHRQGNLFLRLRHAFRHLYRKLSPASSRVQDFGHLLAIDARLNAMFPPLDALYNDYVGVFTWVTARYVTGAYGGKMTFYWAQEEPGIEETWEPVTKAQARGEIATSLVPGTHLSCVTDFIEELAQCMSTSLEQAQQEGE